MAHVRISLANKCQLLFGVAVLAILLVAMGVLWFRMEQLVNESPRVMASMLSDQMLQRGEEEIGSEMTRRWLEKWRFAMLWEPPLPPEAFETIHVNENAYRVALIDVGELAAFEVEDPLIARTVQEYRREGTSAQSFAIDQKDDGRWVYRFARAIRASDLEGTQTGLEAELEGDFVDPLRGILLMEWDHQVPIINQWINIIYLALAGLVSGTLAIAVFWYITTRIILSPVRVLRETAERVSEGDLNTRAEISTGDEFEQLSTAFNHMLATQKQAQDQLRSLNKQLDLRLGELAETNVGLFEANRLKSDFLANVSHELRTPLNSIIGFAELLGESLPEPEYEDGGSDPADKQRRYVRNIIESSRSLLRLINDLLDLAKIERGRMEVTIQQVSIADVCEALVNLIRPQADQKQIELSLAVQKNIPVVDTDAGKLQQILFNFLSNAVKFTPQQGHIELGAAGVKDETDQAAEHEPIVRLWVRDNGPGIPRDRHEEIFDKFRQLDQTHTREFSGTGLGLAISLELAKLLRAEIDLDSEPGKGSTFYLNLPIRHEPQSEPLMPG